MVKLASKLKEDSFWPKLPKPFFVLAPMANVTDFAFRTMIAKYGKPDVMWNEFVSADGLCSPGKARLLHDLKFSDKERPIVAQLFTGHPEAMRKAAQLCAELCFDGIDINMGCPDRAVEKQGGGAAHIKEPKRAIEVLKAARIGWVLGRIKKEKQRGKKIVDMGDFLGVEDISETIGTPNAKESRLTNEEIRVLEALNANDSRLVYQAEKNIGKPSDGILAAQASSIPVSIKTRIGYNKVDLGWLRLLLEQKLPALTVHLRTRKEMSDVPAHWELMPEIVKLRDEVQSDMPKNERTLIIGNGDVQTLAEAREKCDEYGCDGVMIGRGIFGTPWLFSKEEGAGRKKKEKTPEERLKIMLEHATLFEKTFGGANGGKSGKKCLKNFAVMKKHFKAYVSGWDGAKELRVKLMEANDLKEVKRVVKEYLKR